MGKTKRKGSQPAAEGLTPFLAPIQALQNLLSQFNDQGVIIMKAIAHRPKDLADIQAIEASHPKLDKERIRFWVEQFGEALDMPELWKEIEKFL